MQCNAMQCNEMQFNVIPLYLSFLDMAHKVMESFGSDQDEDATEQDKGRNQDVGAGGDTVEAEV